MMLYLKSFLIALSHRIIETQNNKSTALALKSLLELNSYNIKAKFIQH